MKAENTVTYRISEEENICYVTAEGCITLQSCVEFMEAGITNSKIKPGCCMLVDLRKMKYDSEAQEVGYLASYVATKKEYFSGKIALVTTGHRNRAIADLFCFGAAIGGMSINRFSDMDEARKWLNEPVNKKSITGK